MNPRLTRGEYWLLNIVVTSWVPIPWLVSSEPALAWNRMCDHGLDREPLIEILVSMFDRGWIEAEQITRANLADDEDVIEPIVLRHDSVERILDESEERRRDGLRFYYGLTKEGGAVWEAFALPMWERFVDAWDRIPTEKGAAYEGEIFGASKSRIEYFLRLCEDEGEVIEPESIRWEVLTPWEATYWKTLPMGYRVTYRFHDSGARYADLARENAMYRRCYSERWYDWD